MLDELGVPDMVEIFTAAATGKTPRAPYLLADMADDAAALLDGLGIASAHVVGASMGGMIAQTLALKHPARVRTMTSIMSTTGRPGLPGPTPARRRVLFNAAAERRAPRTSSAPSRPGA